VADGQRRLVFGLHAARAVLERRPDAVIQAWLLDRGAGPLAAITETLYRIGTDVRHAGRTELDRLAEGGTHQGIVLEVRGRKEFTVQDFEELVVARERRLRLLVLDQVEDPRNLGACLRTADAAAVDAVVVSKTHSAKMSSVAQKAATGAAESVPVFTAPNLARTLQWLKDAGVWIVGADSAAPQSLHSAKLGPPIAVVLGAEGKGLRRLTRESCDELVAIPMHGTVASLNVSVAAGVVLFELLRQSPPASP
jgi:23S rRNA (guanosine2251-2'-O)-methyltransferase